MALTTTTPLALILLTLIPFLTPQIQAQAPAPAPSGPINITTIFEKAGQYNFLIRLLNETQQLTQIQTQLNSTSEGFTIFAPTDNAFQNLPSGNYEAQTLFRLDVSCVGHASVSDTDTNTTPMITLNYNIFSNYYLYRCVRVMSDGYMCVCASVLYMKQIYLLS